MSFFASNGSYSAGGGDFPVADTDVYRCRLKEVVPCMSNGFEGEEPKPQFRWVFESLDATDEKGQRYRFTAWTGVNYGSDVANLTKLLDNMMGKRLTPAEYEALDLAELQSKVWNVSVTVHTKRNGGQTNKIDWARPERPRPAAPAQSPQARTFGTLGASTRPTSTVALLDENEGLEDPFAE